MVTVIVMQVVHVSMDGVVLIVQLEAVKRLVPVMASGLMINVNVTMDGRVPGVMYDLTNANLNA